jgi:beta-galactosidase
MIEFFYKIIFMTWQPVFVFFVTGFFLNQNCEVQKQSGGKIANQERQTITEKKYSAFQPGEIWLDDKEEVINAHGGGILYENHKYYWFGEKRGRRASEGINVYSSIDLYNWKFESLALAPNDVDSTNDIARGCVMERPKVLYNKETGKYVMWFHLELKGKGYGAARAAVAVSDKVTGPYNFLNSFRPNENMSRDMTLFLDDDGSAYEIYASRDNYDLRIVKLSVDYLTPTADDKMLFSLHREAPALFKYKNKYYLITSACTGWAPNKAIMHVASSITGPWNLIEGNPTVGANADSTYGGQSTFILPVMEKKNAFVFMADRWNAKDLKDSRYLWLPVLFKNDQPYIEWMDEWKLDLFK